MSSSTSHWKKKSYFKKPVEPDSPIPLPSPSSIAKNVHVKVLSQASTTPMPNFDGMNDEDLKKELDRFGARPLCRAKAIRMLRRIYEATHPVLSKSSPLSHRVSRALLKTQKRPTVAKAAEKAREKRTRAAITKFISNDDTASQVCSTNSLETNFAVLDKNSQEQGPASASSSLSSLIVEHFNFELEGTDEILELDGVSQSIDKSVQMASLQTTFTVAKGNSDILLHTFLDWLRLSENEDLYYELLTLNSILFDSLVAKFGSELRLQKISRAKFSEILDQIHVTYCIPQNKK